MAGQQKPWEKYGAPQGPVTLGTPDPSSAYKAPLAQAELQTRRQESQMRALQMQKLGQELQAANGGPPMDPKLDGLTGDEFLSNLKPADAATVKALASGRMAFPSGAALKSPYWQNMLNSVAHFDPTFDSINYQARQATRKDFTSGKSSQNIKALNTAIGHVGQLYDQIGGTASHGGFPFATTVNSLVNSYERGSGDAGISKYEQTAGAVASELTQVFRGSGGAEADVTRYLSELNSNASLDQKKAAVQNIVGLLHSRLEAIADQYQKGMGTSAEPLKILDDHAQHVLSNVMGTPAADGGNGSPPGAPPAGPGRGGSPVPPGGSPRADTSTRYYMDPSKQDDQVGVAGNGSTTVKDPYRVGASAQLAAMLADRSIPDAKIRAFAAQLNAKSKSVEANLAFRRNNPNYTGGYNTKSLQFSEKPLTAAQRFGNWAGDSPVGAAAINAGDAVTMGTLDNMTSNPAMTRALMAGIQQKHPVASTAGAIGGGALMAANLEGGLGKLGVAGTHAAIGGDALYGAGYGAGSADDGNRLAGGALGGIAAVGGGMFGRGLTRTGGRAISGVRNEAVRELQSRGIPMTFGQIVGQSGRVGSAIKGIEDRLTGLPVVGDVVNARRREGVQGLNSAAFREGLAPIGQTAAGTVGEQGIDDARQLISQSYDDTLSGVRFPVDAQFKTDLGGAQALGSRIPTMGDHFNYTLAEKVIPNIDPVTEEVTGKGFQAMKQSLRGDAAQFRGQPRGPDIADAYGLVEGALDRVAERSVPGIAGKLRANNTAYRNLNILGDAVGKGVNTEGLFTPAQLGMAARSNAQRFGGKLDAASTDRPFFDLQRAAQTVLPNKVPDSGTSGRGATAMALGAVAGAGGATGYAAGDAQTGAETSLGTLMALAVGGSRPAQRALSRLMLDRPDTMVRAGQALGRRAPIGGMFGAGAAPLLLPEQ